MNTNNSNKNDSSNSYKFATYFRAILVEVLRRSAETVVFL